MLATLADVKSLGLKVGIAPRFQIQSNWPERLKTGHDHSWHDLETEDWESSPDIRGWEEQISLFALPSHLQNRWWERVVTELTSAFYSGDEYEAFVREIIDFAHFKNLPLPESCQFALLLSSEETAGQDTKAVMNMGDAPAWVAIKALNSTSELRLALAPGEGCWIPEGLTARPVLNAASEEPVMLLTLLRTKPAPLLVTTTLKPGVRIYSSLEVSQDAPTRLRLSSGTYANDPPTHEGYAKGAILPRLPWHPPTEDEAKILWTTELEGSADSTLALLKIPAELFALFLELKVADVTTAEEYTNLRQTEGFRAAVLRVLDYVEPFRQSDEPFEIAAVFSPPGLPAVTLDRQVGQYIGLHFDDWDRLSLSSRGLGQNRIVINLGHEDREFMFVNLTVLELVRAVREGGGKIGDHHAEWRDLVKKFCNMYPDYPVVKVRIAPGEAYMGPTENLIHDGTTIGRNHPDVHLTVRGYLWPKEPLPQHAGSV